MVSLVRLGCLPRCKGCSRPPRLTCVPAPYLARNPYLISARYALPCVCMLGHTNKLLYTNGAPPRPCSFLFVVVSMMRPPIRPLSGGGFLFRPAAPPTPVPAQRPAPLKSIQRRPVPIPNPSSGPVPAPFARWPCSAPARSGGPPPFRGRACPPRSYTCILLGGSGGRAAPPAKPCARARAPGAQMPRHEVLTSLGVKSTLMLKYGATRPILDLPDKTPHWATGPVRLCRPPARR